MSSLAFLLMDLHISTYSTRRFIGALVGDDVLDSSGFLIALATLDALCCIMSVMVSLMVSMSYSSYSVSNWFLNSSWSSIILYPICVASPLGGLFFDPEILSTPCT